MEPTKITSIAELQLRNAGACAKSIVTLIDDLSFAAPEDIDGHRGRLAQIAARLTELTQALKIAPPRPTGAADAPAVHDLQQRIQALEGNIRRHREQRAVILEALGGVTWEQAVPRARELVASVKTAEAELTAIHQAMPQGEAVVPLSQRVAQLVREHREMAEEMVKAAGTDEVLAAAAQRISEVCEGCGGALCERCNGCHGNGPNDPLVGACPQQVRICPRKQKDIADEVSRERRSMPFIDIVIDGPPGPIAGRFVEVEDPRGRSIHVGQWIDRGDSWALRIPMPGTAAAAQHDERLVELEDVAIAGTLSALDAVITTSALDWERYPCLAWIYGVLVGHGADALDQLQQAYGWGDGTVEEIEGHRRVLLAARGVDVL